mgnify:CR=1 FL=1
MVLWPWVGESFGETERSGSAATPPTPIGVRRVMGYICEYAAHWRGTWATHVIYADGCAFGRGGRLLWKSSGFGWHLEPKNARISPWGLPKSGQKDGSRRKWTPRMQELARGSCQKRGQKAGNRQKWTPRLEDLARGSCQKRGQKAGTVALDRQASARVRAEKRGANRVMGREQLVWWAGGLGRGG